MNLASVFRSVEFCLKLKFQVLTMILQKYFLLSAVLQICWACGFAISTYNMHIEAL